MRISLDMHKMSQTDDDSILAVVGSRCLFQRTSYIHVVDAMHGGLDSASLQQ